MPECCHCTIAKIQEVLPKGHVKNPKTKGQKSLHRAILVGSLNENWNINFHYRGKVRNAVCSNWFELLKDEKIFAYRSLHG